MTRRFVVRAALAVAVAVLAGAGASRLGEALIVERPLERPDAIVVLASHEWERLPAAARIAREHPDALVLLTQPRVVTPVTCHECAGRRDWLIRAGVAAGRVVLMPGLAGNTFEEALVTRAFAAPRGLTRLVVVTSPYHSRRALATFRHVLGPAVTVGVDPARPEARPVPGAWWSRGYDRWYVAYESAALVKYVIWYRVWPRVGPGRDAAGKSLR